MNRALDLFVVKGCYFEDNGTRVNAGFSGFSHSRCTLGFGQDMFWGCERGVCPVGFWFLGFV